MPTIGYSYTTDNEELPVKDGASTNPNTRGFISVGVDALGVARFVRTDASGRIEIAGGGGVLGIVDQGSPAAVADAWPIKVTDGVDTAAIAPASTAALASDPSLVVQVSPNQTAIPVSVSGSVTANQGTAAATASAWPIKLTDGTDTAAILPGSTVPLAGDAALVVSLSPNLAVGTASNPLRVDPTGTTTQPVSVTSGSITVAGTVTANQGTAAATASAWPIKVTDGIDTAAVAPASTAPLATDPSLVVQISPNQPAVPVSVSGSVTANQGTPAATANAWPAKLTDGVDTAAILPSSTVPVVADPALVVTLSPNLAVGTASNPLRIDPTGTTTQNVNVVGGSVTVAGTSTSKIADEDGNFYTSSFKNNTRSLAVESRDLVLLLGQILGELRVMRAQLASITDEDDPL